MKKLSSLSVFFPSLNDAKILPYLICRTYGTVSKITKDFEIIVINDGSTDETKEILKVLEKKLSCLKIIHHEKNLGYGAALIAGFQQAKKDWVFYTDGDGQYDPAEIELLMNKLSENIDVVNGFKLGRSDNYLRRIIGSAYNIGMHKLYDLPISDIDCDFRLIRKSLLDDIDLKSSSGNICLELILKLRKKGTRFAETGIHHYPRPFGHSQFFNFRNISKTIFDNIQINVFSKKSI